MIIFNKTYFILTLILFIIEIIIGFYLHDNLIRPFAGDLLVVILIYTSLKSFFSVPVLPMVAIVLTFSFIIEVTQYFHLISFMGLQNSKIAAILLGTSFSVADLLCYLTGCLVIIITGYVLNRLNITLKWKQNL